MPCGVWSRHQRSAVRAERLRVTLSSVLMQRPRPPRTWLSWSATAAARPHVLLAIADFAASGLLEQIEPHTYKVPRGDRSGAVIEPWLTPQWYVDAKKLAEPAIKAVETGAIEFVPKQWENTYFAWMRDIQDWCISRQLWWGHRIPAWYDDAGNVYVGESESKVREAHSIPDETPLRQDDDVLDTWFSSALWTFSTLGWPDKKNDLLAFHPASVLVTGFDIIFFWVARMIMMSLHFMEEVPFHTVYVHGLVRDGEGQYRGGPAFYLSKGLKAPWERLVNLEMVNLTGTKVTGSEEDLRAVLPASCKRVYAAEDGWDL